MHYISTLNYHHYQYNMLGHSVVHMQHDRAWNWRLKTCTDSQGFDKCPFYFYQHKGPPVLGIGSFC